VTDVPTDVLTAVAAAFRTEWAKIVASLIGWCGDWDLAEECAQEAFALALRTWPRDGVPDRPGAWLTTVARRRAVDRLRRDQLAETKLKAMPPPVESEEEEIGDDRLRLIFTCCHPALSFEAQVSLALRTLTGLTTAEIARAFVVPEATMAKRLTRAKQKIREAGIPYRVPSAHLLPERTTAALGVVYLLFNEGYVATGGDALDRPQLREEALRLAALVVELMPDDPEARGLLALLLLHQARAASRTDPDGTLIPLEQQDRSTWDRTLIGAGLAELRHAARRERLGPYQLQAMIAARHVTAAGAADTDWPRIVELYDVLLTLVPSQTVALNRAVAVAMASGPDAGLAELSELDSLSHLLPAARADLLRRLNRPSPAAEQYREALSRTENEGERRYLTRRLSELDPPKTE
jgi:RNA polymerase sigma-70 factor (ECF subfamily)